MSKKNDNISRSRQQADILLSREDFTDDIRKIYDKMPLFPTDLDREINHLAKKYKLGPSWTLGLRQYAESLDPNKLLRLNGLQLATERNEKTGIEELWIRIDPDTTLEDIKDRWPYVKRRQKLLQYSGKKKFQPIDKAVLEKNKMAYDLSRRSYSHQQIAEKLNEKYDEAFTYADIPTMIRNYKKLTGIN